MNRLELEREVGRRRQAIGRSFEKEHSMDEGVERLAYDPRYTWDWRPYVRDHNPYQRRPENP